MILIGLSILLVLLIGWLIYAYAFATPHLEIREVESWDTNAYGKQIQVTDGYVIARVAAGIVLCYLDRFVRKSDGTTVYEEVESLKYTVKRNKEEVEGLYNDIITHPDRYVRVRYDIGW